MAFRGHCLPEVSKLTRENSDSVPVSLYGKSKDPALSVYKFLAGTRLPPLTPHHRGCSPSTCFGGGCVPGFLEKETEVQDSGHLREPGAGQEGTGAPHLSPLLQCPKGHEDGTPVNSRTAPGGPLPPAPLLPGSADALWQPRRFIQGGTSSPAPPFDSSHNKQPGSLGPAAGEGGGPSAGRPVCTEWEQVRGRVPGARPVAWETPGDMQRPSAP